MTEKINLVIIIVNYNSALDTLDCVKSITASKTSYAYKIIVVDNNSSDASQSILLQSKIDFDFVVSNVNNGYCAGNNNGIYYAERKYNFDYVWILNPDTKIENDAIENLLRFAYAHKDYGLIGSLLIYDFDKDTIQALGGSNIGFSKKLNFQILKQSYHGELFSAIGRDLPSVLHCVSLVGAALLVKKEVFAKIGYFDESYFLYSDETEFCIRVAKKTDLKICGLSSVRVFHKEGSQKADRKAITNYYLTRNWLFNVKKYYPLLLPYVILYHVVFLLKLKFQKKNELFYYTKYALRDFIKNIKGKFYHKTF